MKETADIVIIGGGIIGMSTAFQLARRTSAKIVVLERGSGPGEGSTGASSAVCRFKYSFPETVQLALDGVRAYQHWPEFLELADPFATFHNIGVLWFGGSAQGWADREAVRLSALGVRVEVAEDSDLARRFPALNTCQVAPDFLTAEPHVCRGGAKHLLELDGGYVDPVSALQDLIRAARGLGVEVRFNSRVEKIMVGGGKVAGLALTGGSAIHCPSIVNAAGAWCHEIYEAAGVECPWPLKPTRIQIALVDRPPEVKGDLPVCIDIPGGIYFRPQNRGQQLVIGSILERDEEEEIDCPDDFANFADDDFIREKLYGVQHRLPALSSPRGVRGYSGLYTMNRADVHPVVGRTPLDGFYAANGCSGHGFKLAPAIGSLLAQEITGHRIAFDTAVDPDFLSFNREPIPVLTKSVLA